MHTRGRRHPVHSPVLERGFDPIIVFVTVCTANRKPILARPAAHDLIRDAWLRARSWMVGRYVILPDHIHLFCAPVAGAGIVQWVRFWRAQVSSHWRWPEEQPIWQRDFWDTQLRRAESYESKWEYVRANPVRHGFVESPDAWPYAGEVNVLSW